MTAAAIASVAVSAFGANEASNQADEAREQSDEQAMMAAIQRQEAMDNVASNQANVDQLQEFLTGQGEAGIAQAQGFMDDWEQTFGGLEDNLSTYYNNLDPTKFATEAKTKYSQQLAKQMQQYNDTLSASGLQSAGMKAQTAKEAMFKQAETNASIDINAPEQVAQMQQGFLELGSTKQKQAYESSINALNNQTALGAQGFNAQTAQNQRMTTAMNSQAASYDQSAANYGASAAGYENTAGNLWGSAINTGLEYGPGIYDSLTGAPNGGVTPTTSSAFDNSVVGAF